MREGGDLVVRSDLKRDVSHPGDPVTDAVASSTAFHLGSQNLSNKLGHAPMQDPESAFRQIPLEMCDSSVITGT